MKLTEAILLKESPQSDMEQLRAANDIFSDLVNSLNNLPLMAYQWRQMPYKGKVLDAVFIDKKDMDDVPFDLVLLPKEGREQGGMTFDPPRMYIFLDQEGDLASQVANERRLVIHELVHFLDVHRMGSYTKSSGLSDRDYYNHPMETNAYYMEAIDRYQETMRKLLSSSRTAYENIMRKFSTFDGWMEYMDYIMDEDYRGWLNVKNDRALKRRLYRYWDENVK